jgi:hypothetical protein
MHQPEPAEAPPDLDERAIERRFAELLRRFWRRPASTDPSDQGDMP